MNSLLAFIVIASPPVKADERVALCFQTQPGAQLQVRTLDLADGRWRLAWSHQPKWKEARAISVASLGDRVGVIWSIGSQKRFSEFDVSSGRSIGSARPISAYAKAVFVSGGRPLALDEGGEPHLLGTQRRRAAFSSATVISGGTFLLAAGTQDGKYALTAYSEAARGSSFSFIHSYRVGRVMRKTMEPLDMSPGLHDLAVSGSNVAIARGTSDVAFYRIGPSGLALLDAIQVQPSVYALTPLRKDVGFHGLTEKGIVVLQPEGKRWSQRPVLALEVGHQAEPQFLGTPNYLVLIIRKTVYRMRRGQSGSLSLQGQSSLPPGWIR